MLRKSLEVAFYFDDSPYTFSDVLVTGALCGEWPLLVARARVEEAADDPRTADAERTGDEVLRFRRERRLEAASDLRAWLAERDLDEDDLLRHARAAAAARQEDEPAGPPGNGRMRAADGAWWPAAVLGGAVERWAGTLERWLAARVVQAGQEAGSAVRSSGTEAALTRSLLDLARASGVLDTARGADARRAGELAALLAAAGQDDGTAGPRLEGQMGRKHPLAAPGRPGQEGKAAFAGGDDLGEQFPQAVEFGLPAHQPAGWLRLDERRERDESPVGLSFPHDFDGRQRFGQSLQFQRPGRLEGVPPSAGQLRHQFIGEHLAAAAVVTKPRRFDHRHAEVVAILGHGRITGAQTHPDLQPLARGPVAALSPLLHGRGAGQPGGGAVEHCHQAVAGVLHVAAASLLDRTLDQAEVLEPDGVGDGGTDPRLECR
jgi:hypothetical protein